MPLPQEATDFFDTLLGRTPSNDSVGAIPSVSGLGTRQSKIKNERTAQSTRKIMHWLIPEGPIVQMYINPQSITYNYAKDISSERTKGGFVIQYWGEKLIELGISGTTGTSGIEGINVLMDVYRNEQLAFEPYALFLAAKQQQDSFAGDIFGTSSALTSGESFLSTIIGASETPAPQVYQQGPTLASLAATVELYWSGEVYRGYFISLQVKESADALGLFNYDIKFIATQKRGFRTNFLAWHRSATSGPSNSDPIFGNPYSFKNLLT